MNIKAQMGEYGTQVQKLLTKTNKGLPKVRTNINQTDCPHWALDLIEELGGDSAEVTRKNLFQSLSTALANDELINEKYPQLVEIVQIAVIKEITFKPNYNSAVKQKNDSRRKMSLMIKLLNANLRDLLDGIQKGDRFTYVPQYIADTKGLLGAKAIKPETFYKALACAWDLDQGSDPDADSYVNIKGFIKDNKTARLIFKSFTPIKVPI